MLKLQPACFLLAPEVMKITMLLKAMDDFVGDQAMVEGYGGWKVRKAEARDTCSLVKECCFLEIPQLKLERG